MIRQMTCKGIMLLSSGILKSHISKGVKILEGGLNLQSMVPTQKYGDMNLIREIIEIHRNNKSIKVLKVYDVDFMIESLCKLISIS